MNKANNQAAKYAFFYMLSLVALVFMALSTGMIIFQIINKNIVDILNEYRGLYNPDILKFAISSIIIATPIYFITMQQINKNLFNGNLNKDSGIRKWLTYFILFISSVVMLVWMIITINRFLDGELTTKFLLKSITVIGIAATIFSFYFYDIRREEVKGEKNRVINIYFFSTIVVLIVVFISSLLIVESPTETRNRKFDNMVLDDFSRIDGAVKTYYREKNELPTSLEIIKEEFNYITGESLMDPVTEEAYEYKITGDKEYELCAEFRTDNTGEKNSTQYEPYKDLWPHTAGKQCIKQKIFTDSERKEIMPIPAR